MVMMKAKVRVKKAALIKAMNNSTFDALMSEADNALLDHFGTPLQIIFLPGEEPQLIQVDIETELSVQELGERGRSSNTQRNQSLILASLHHSSVPEKVKLARLVYKDQRYIFTEPKPDGDLVEFILLPEPAANEAGDRHSTFF
jgi:hypothetical protein